MFIVWGSRLMGKCDVVPGLFHVATKFGHIYYLPLIPTQTYVVLSQSGKKFRGVPVSMSFKSILVAWLRAATLVGGLIFGIAAMVCAMDQHPSPWVPWLIMAILCWGGYIALSFTKFATRASFARACELGKAMKLNEAGFAQISKVYGQAIPRGFAVVTPAPVAAIPLPPMPGFARATPVAGVARSAPKPVAGSGAPLPPFSFNDVGSIPLDGDDNIITDTDQPAGNGPELGLH